jgi:ribonuclease R
MSKKHTRKQRVIDELAKTALGVIRKSGGPGINSKQLALQMGLRDKAQKVLLYEAIDKLLSENRIRPGKKGRLKPINGDSEITGTIEFIGNGNAFVRAVKGPDIFVRRDRTGNAFHGDTVRVKQYGNRKASRPEGKVLQVLQRNRTTYVGTVHEQRKVLFLVPDDKRIPDYFAILPQKTGEPVSPGQKVVVELIDAGNQHQPPTCEVIRVLGNVGDHEVEMNAIMWEYGLPMEFPHEVLAEAEKIQDGATEQEIAGRRDMRKETTITIDPYDAKDLDDALSIKHLDNGNLQVGIHIADVSFYVRTKGAIEKEARSRATSIYLVDRVIPMLPERLSNELCSLNPGVDKLCYSTVLELKPTGKVVNRWFGRTVIHCNIRFSYEEAQEVIDGSPHPLSKEILSLHKVAEHLRSDRMKSGSLEVISKEVRFKLGENGEPVEVYEKIMKPANWLIEEFMLLANKEVAKKGGSQSGKPRPFVYRVHDVPDPEKISELLRLIKAYGYEFKQNPGEDLNLALNRFLKSIRGKEEEGTIQQMLIRSMAKAVYTTENIGHYGLAFTHYTHFTSPIRRYPDLMVHRALEHYLKGGKPLDENELGLLCKHSSAQEKRASEAERASIRYKQTEYLNARLGQEFDGTINSTTKWGMFITLNENHCEGLVPLKEIDGDMYYFDEERYEIRGQRKGKTFRVGDHVRVRIDAVDMQRREVTLALLSNQVESTI